MRKFLNFLPDLLFFCGLLLVLALFLTSKFRDTLDISYKCESGVHYYFGLSKGNDIFILPYESNRWNYETISAGEKFEIHRPLPLFLIDVVKGSMSPCLLNMSALNHGPDDQPASWQKRNLEWNH